MQPSGESSVLFALDELRDIEEIRKRDQRELARKQARARARALEEEEQRRVAAEEAAAREASELARLQAQAADDARSRRILEAQLAADAQTNAALQSRLCLLEEAAAAPSAALLVQSKVNRIHASWAIALVATLGAFLVLESTRKVPAPRALSTVAPPPSAAPALALAPDCPQPVSSNERSAIAPAASADHDAAPASKVRPPRDTRGHGGGTSKPAQHPPIDISACGDDPLGCMPE